MAPLSLSPQTNLELKKLIDDACSNPNVDLPYAAVVVVGRDDNGIRELFAYSSSGLFTHELVTSIACMQLVEEGSLALDDVHQVETLCPELRDVKVVQEDGSLVDKKRGITLRMLLTHTAGFGYSFLNPKLEKYNASYDEFSGSFSDFLQPLVNQPGERFEYGISLDWAGILVERASGLKLNDFMQRNIFLPLQIRNLTMVPSAQMKDRLAHLWQRSADGRLSRGVIPLSRALSTDPAEVADTFHSGGAGLFGSIQEYSKILATLLNDGTCPLTGARILSPTAVAKLFTNQLPDAPNFARRHLPAVKPSLVHPSESLYPLCPPALPQGWGFGSMISPGVTGRSDTTAHWSGLSNVFWWLDRGKGVAGVVASQVLPFVDPQAAMLWVGVERLVYRGIAHKEREA